MFARLPSSVGRRCLRGQASFRRLSTAAAAAAVPPAKSGRQWSTPLAKQLGEAIEVCFFGETQLTIQTTGPISLATYMRHCLTSNTGGYYTSARAHGGDQFGTKGDFVTSPEISQVFGELVGVWITAEWMIQGWQNDRVVIVELGPGRGTLMSDVLRTIRNFPPLQKAITAVHLIEASPDLRKAQHELLCGDAPFEQSESGYSSRTLHTNTPIFWHEALKDMKDTEMFTPFIIAHEFFDALPFHAFQSVLKTTKRPTDTKEDTSPRTEWRELLVSPTPIDATHATLGTPHSQRREPVPDFQLAVANRSTTQSMLLPKSSSRFERLLETPGSTIEINSEAIAVTRQVAKLIGDPLAQQRFTAAGAALFIDYGPTSTVPANSLRGIRQHRIVSPFSQPGQVDLSGDVDFGALVEAALDASEHVEVHGPVDQSFFLNSMGIEQRTAALKSAGADAQDINAAVARLTHRGINGMGKLYKAMAIVPARDGRKPVGFGGDLSREDLNPEVSRGKVLSKMAQVKAQLENEKRKQLEEKSAMWEAYDRRNGIVGRDAIKPRKPEEIY